MNFKKLVEQKRKQLRKTHIFVGFKFRKRKAVPFDPDTQFIICADYSQHPPLLWKRETNPRQFLSPAKAHGFAKEHKAIIIDCTPNNNYHSYHNIK